MGKNDKTGAESRGTKSNDVVTNDNSKIVEAAAKQKAEQLAARAKAVGLDSDASEHDIANAEFKAINDANIARNERLEKLKVENHKLWMLSNTIEREFAERAKTNMPALTESEIRHVCGPVGASVSMEFDYSNDEKTEGTIVLKEFDSEVTLPHEGHYTFSFDYAAAAKANKNEPKVANEKIVK